MKKCELLVPAGGIDQFIAAVENGADAIYVGGKLFNARINADNFDLQTLEQAVDFAHKRGVKVHVTMNTLIKDDEMKEALEYALALYEMGVDALIVQDMGLAMLLKENLPDFSIHLSTQGSAYDLRGVKAAAKAGFDRVVLARELSFDEIKAICQQTDTEIEVFVHGAMCICYSGQCQMSRSFGGRSGNRGECAQPCRLPYKSLDSEGRLIKTFRYPLSPKDLCLIDHIGELADAGVASLKIEGRMKSAEYVAVVTSIYRKYLDMHYAKESYVVTPEDREALEQIFNRGGFTEGYFYENLGSDLMAGDIPKHRGIKIGKVVKKGQGSSLIDVKLYHKLSIGDGVEIQGQDITGNVVTYYKELKGGLTRIGDIKGRVAHGDPLYRITSKEQLTEARRSFENKTFEEGKYIRKTPVDMEFACDEKGMAKLILKSPLTEEVVTVIDGPFEKDAERNMDRGRIEKALSKTGNTPFEVGDLVIQEDIDRKIQISSINDMRRKGLVDMENLLTPKRSSKDVPRLMASEEQKKDQALEFFFYSYEDFARFTVGGELGQLECKKRYLIPAVEFEQHFDEIGSRPDVVPYITNISKGKEDSFIEKHFESICNHCRERGIYVGNLGWIQSFDKAGIPVYGDYGLNVYNAFAEKHYNSLGTRYCIESLEAETVGAGFPLMITEHRPKGDWLIDRRKEKIAVIKRTFSDQTLLIPEKPVVDVQRIKEAFSTGKRIVRIYL